MTAWWEGPMVALDTETTGTDVESARIVTASVVVIRETGGSLTWEWLADPGVEIPAEAAAIHGVTTEKARAHGQSAREVVGEVASVISQHWLPEAPLVVYNAPYDLSLLDREMRRHFGRPWLVPPVNLPVVDPLVIDKGLDTYRKGSRKLVDVAAHYGVELTAEDAHGSTADALAAARVAWMLAKRFPAELADLARLQELQVMWKAEQAASLAEYLRRQGKPADIDGSWPLVPFVDTAVA